MLRNSVEALAYVPLPYSIDGAFEKAICNVKWVDEIADTAEVDMSWNVMSACCNDIAYET